MATPKTVTSAHILWKMKETPKSKYTSSLNQAILIIATILLAIFVVMLFANQEFKTDFTCTTLISLANINPTANVDSSSCGTKLPNSECYPAPCGFLQGEGCYSCKGIGLVKEQYNCKHITADEWILKQAPECKSVLDRFNNQTK